MSSKQDATGVRTAQDLERKYDLASLVGIKKAVEKTQAGLTNTNSELINFINSTVENIEELQNQIDGNVTTWFYNGVPTTENAPANEWNTEKEKNIHLGDLYYDQDTGYAYRWALVNEEYVWTRIIDADVVEALAIAAAAQDTADSKRRIFVVQPTPPYDVGDIWIFNDSDLYRCSASRQEGSFNSTDWIIATKYTDDTAANNVKAELDSYKELVKTEYVSQSSFTTSNNEIKGMVREVGVKVGMKNTIYTTKPTPPYIVGDAYIINDKVYICKTPRTENETYNSNDWELSIDNTDLVNQSTLTQTAKELKAEVIKVDNKVGEQNTKIATISENVEEIQAQLSNIADITTSAETSFASLSLTGINNSEPIYIKVMPTTENISYLYPSSGLFLSPDLYLPIRNLRFINTKTNRYLDYELPDDLLIYDEDTRDEFILNYESRICQIIKRCEYAADGSVYKLNEAKVTTYEYPKIELETGDYTISLPGYKDGYLFVRLMTSNYYTTQFYTKAETNSKISETAQNITLDVNTKLSSAEQTSNARYAELNSKIEVTEKNIKNEVSETYTTIATYNDTTDSLKNDIDAANKKADSASATSTEANNLAQNVSNSLTNYATSSALTTVQNSVTSIQTSLNAQIDVTNEIVKNGVSQVKTSTGFTFDKDGLSIEKTGAQTSSNFNEDGLKIFDASSATKNIMLDVDHTGVNAENITVRTFFNVGSHSRIQDYENATGIYYLG